MAFVDAGCSVAGVTLAFRSLQNGPGDVSLESETDAEAILVKPLAVDHFAANGSFAFDWSKLSLLAELPQTGGMHSSTTWTDVVCIGSFAFFGTHLRYGCETHHNHDVESSFFSAVVPGHACWPLLVKL